MTKVLKGITNLSSCPICHRPVGEEHSMGCSEAAMQEAAKRRPENFGKLSSEQQWAIDRSLGCLDWEGY